MKLALIAVCFESKKRMNT